MGGKIKKGLDSLKNYGLGEFAYEVKKRVIKKEISNIVPDLPYEIWRKRIAVDVEGLKEQRETKFSYEPTFDLVVPLYDAHETYLHDLVESVQAQTYRNWCLHLVNVNRSKKTGWILNRKYGKEQKISLSQRINGAIAMGEGDFVAFLEQGDLLLPNALFECVKVLNDKERNEEFPIDFFYTDEDQIDETGDRFFGHRFKPDFSMDYLCSKNYISHLFGVKREIIDKVGRWNGKYGRAQAYDFILRAVEVAKNIYHVPMVLYHGRSPAVANILDLEKTAVEAHYKRLGIPAKVERQSEFPGVCRSRFFYKENPLISILIPNKDHVEDLKKCIASIDEKSSYRHYEFIIMENNSVEEETFLFYQELELRENVSVVRYEGNFNYSKLNNFGASHAKGEYLLLLNNDTEIRNMECLEELLGYCMREDVGIVGARLYYEDGSIQHAGTIVGPGGVARHAFLEALPSDPGYMDRIVCAQNVSAVTAACMMVKKQVYEAVGGMTQELEVSFNDVDFCLKVRELGKLIVYNPYAQLWHYESKTRGAEDTPEKYERHTQEVKFFQERWKDFLNQGDPYYNPNFSLAFDQGDFTLKKVGCWFNEEDSKKKVQVYIDSDGTGCTEEDSFFEDPTILENGMRRVRLSIPATAKEFRVDPYPVGCEVKIKKIFAENNRGYRIPFQSNGEWNEGGMRVLFDTDDPQFNFRELCGVNDVLQMEFWANPIKNTLAKKSEKK